MLAFAGVSALAGLASWEWRVAETHRQRAELAKDAAQLAEKKAKQSRNVLLDLLDPLIAKTESMDEEEKQTWRLLLPNMTDKQVTGLLEILFTEKVKLEAVENNYRKQIENYLAARFVRLKKYT